MHRIRPSYLFGKAALLAAVVGGSAFAAGLPTPAPAASVASATLDAAGFAPVGHHLVDAENPERPFRIEIDTADGNRRFQDGERMSYVVRTDRDVYLTIIQVQPDGVATLLLPNKAQKSTLVRANRAVEIPADDAGWHFYAAAPHGRTVVKVFATTKPMRLAGVTDERIDEDTVIELGDVRSNEKSIRIRYEGDPAETGGGADPGLRGRALLDHVFGADGWGTTSLVITTEGEREPKPDRARPEPMRPGLRKSALTPPRSGRDRNELVLDLWRRATGQTKGLGDDLQGPLREPTPAEVTGLIVVRRVTGTQKSLGANDGYVEQLVPLPSSKGAGPSLEETIEGMRERDTSIVAVIPDYILMPQDLPGTALAEVQWGLHNGVNPEFDTAWEPVSEEAMSIEPVLVGVVDSGLALPDDRLRALAWVNRGEVPGNGTDDDGNGYVDDVHGFNFVTGNGELWDETDPSNHGSFCSSIIAAAPVGRRDDVIGVAPRAKVISAVVLQQGKGASTSDVLRAIRYAADQGARVINLSLGGEIRGEKAWDEITKHPIWEELERKGVLLVAAAGNYDKDNDESHFFPANLPFENVISVMAIDPAGVRARAYDSRNDDWKPFSNYGRNTVHIAAPGSLVLGVPAPDKIAVKDGTSFAAPMVAGAAALVWGKHPDWDYKRVRRALLETARPVRGLEDECVTGGMLDVESALRWTP